MISLMFIQCKKEEESSSAVFWIPSEQAAIFKAGGVDYIKIYMDTTHVGNLSMDTNFESAPDCNNPDAVSFSTEVDPDYSYYLTFMSPDTSFIVEEQIAFSDAGCKTINIAGTEE